MRFGPIAGGLLALLLAAPARGNDTMAELGTRGLSFVRSDRIEMQSEDLFVSPEEIHITYTFRNTGQDDEDVLVAFPVPDIEGSMDFMTSVPTEDPDNLFGFSTRFEGKPVEAELYSYVFAAGIERTDYLRQHQIPLPPQITATQDAVNALDDATKREMRQLGLLMATEYDDNGATKTDYTPIWTLRSTYGWKARFPAGKTVTVEHRYKPSVGGTTGVTFMPDGGGTPERLAEVRQKYCLDDDIVKRVKASAIKNGDYTDYPFRESWISYIWSTGANWAGTIGRFTLTVDKGLTKNLVSFCGENVRKIGPTTFQMTATDWSPPYGRELDIMLLEPRDP